MACHLVVQSDCRASYTILLIEESSIDEFGKRKSLNIDYLNLITVNCPHSII